MKPKCVIDYSTYMHGVDTADQYLAYYPFIHKTVTWPKKVFSSLLQCCIFNNYVTFSKNNPNSCKSFLDFMSDIAENLIHMSDAVSSPSSSSDKSQGSSRTPTSIPPKHAPKNDPPGRLDGKLKNHQLVHIPRTKNFKMPTRKCRVCARNNIKKETRFLCAQCGISSASTRLLHTISHAETLLKVCSKFQVFISYSFCVIIFLLKSWKKGLWTL